MVGSAVVLNVAQYRLLSTVGHGDCCRPDLGSDDARKAHPRAQLHDALTPEIVAVVREEFGEQDGRGPYEQPVVA